MDLDYSEAVMNDLISICNYLGVRYDLSDKDSFCEAISYLICQIKEFIGGSEDA